jgi:hypothetical protein
MVSRTEPFSPVRYVGVGAQEAFEAAIRRLFELYDRLKAKRKRRTPPGEEGSSAQKD